MISNLVVLILKYTKTFSWNTWVPGTCGTLLNMPLHVMCTCTYSRYMKPWLTKWWNTVWSWFFVSMKNSNTVQLFIHAKTCKNMSDKISLEKKVNSRKTNFIIEMIRSVNINKCQSNCVLVKWKLKTLQWWKSHLGHF